MTKDIDQKTGLPSTRKQAKEIGAQYYFTGKPCIRNHICNRFTSNGWCSECAKDDTRLAARQRREKNIEEVNKKQKEWRNKNPEKVKWYKQEWDSKNPEKVKSKYMNFLTKNPTYERDRSRERRKAETPEDKKVHSVRMAQWRSLNPDKNKATAKRSSEKRLSTPRGKMDAAIRNGINATIRKGSKAGRRTFEILGYTVEELTDHLESQFKPGMTWENHGRYGWHIDHIIPLAAFNYETPYDLDFKRAWALGNLQPMWAEDNIRKHAKLDEPFQPSLALAVQEKNVAH